LLKVFLYFITDSWISLKHAIYDFYETDPALTIFMGVSISLVIVLVTACCITGFFHTCKKVFGRHGKYVLPHGRTVPDNKDKYEMVELDDIAIRQDQSINEQPRRTKVMITDDYGNIPSYTLRTRSVDGSPDKYTTYYNYRLVKETEL